MPKQAPEPNGAPNTIPEGLDGLRGLVAQARQGDGSAVPRLRAHLEAHPETWSRCIALRDRSVAAWLDLACGGDLYVRTALEHETRPLRTRLLGDDVSPVLDLAADRVLVGWLAVRFFDNLIAKNPDVSPTDRRRLHNDLATANRRHLATLREFAQLQRLIGKTTTAGEQQ